MTEVGVDWYKGLQHIELLQSFKELGSLNECPNHYQTDILIWMALTYIGQEESNTKHIRAVADLVDPMFSSKSR